MYLLIMVLDDVEHLNDVLKAWEKVGISRVTIMESTGVGRVLERHHASAPMAGFGNLFGGIRPGHNTLMAVIDDMGQAEAAAAAAESVIGSLDNPHTGILFTVPVARFWGAGKTNSN